jgi:hypothetical protein
MRFIVGEQREISLDIIEAALKHVDSRYCLASKDPHREQAELMLGPDLYGELEINRRGSEFMDEELEELLEDVNHAEGDGVERVVNLLKGHTFMIVLRVLWQGRDSKSTLQTIYPLWEWAFREYRGLLQADGEGYYDMNAQVLEVA